MAAKPLTARKSDRIDLSMRVKDATASELWRAYIRREYGRLLRAGEVQ
jgi:hypothetical protein